MTRIVFCIYCLIGIVRFSFAQNEANIWYFGQNAGIDFNSGVPVALTDGALDTQEGCATISNTSGNLLFYTDGVTVYNRIHNIMMNGTGLNGHFSSSQSAIIIPVPNTTTQYIIFTVDSQAGFKGLNYSLVDMTLDGGLGSITTKNVQLIAPTLEKVTAVKHANGNDIWVITHQRGTDAFYSYLVTNSGVNPSPVITHISFIVGTDYNFDNAGYLKASPDGSKIAIAHGMNSNSLNVLDFDNNTGILTNAINVYNGPGKMIYGVEFSANSKVLYVSSINGSSGGVFQYDLNQTNAFNILSSQVSLVGPYSGSSWRALQLAVDGKIYVTREAYDGEPDIHALSVINNPNVLGLGCDFQIDTVPLGSGVSKQGLPPFIQSFFIIGFQAEDVCFGEATQFNANISQPYNSILWDFGDGTTSIQENPSHTYASAGIYNVSLMVTSNGQTSNHSKSVTVFEMPVAYPIPDQIVCNYAQQMELDINLSVYTADILGGQDPSQFSVTYYDGIANYNNNIPLSPPVFQLLSLASANPVASVRNINNPNCEAITSFNVAVLEAAHPTTNIPDLTTCDNTSVGTDNDGFVIFDLTQNESYILNGQSSTSFTISYFTDVALTNQINNPSAYQNTNTSETIYVQITNVTNNGCAVQTSFNIEVFAVPTVNPIVELKQCDDDLDGFSIFNLTEVNAELTANYLNETITFYETQTDAENASNVIPNVTTYTNQTVSTDTIWARIETNNGCYKVSQVNLIVSTTQIPNTFAREFYNCDDGLSTTDGIATFDFSSVNADIVALFPIGQQLTINYYRNQSDALSESNPIPDITNYQNIGYPNTQDIFIRVDSVLDNDCLGLGNYITLNVETVPVANQVVVSEQCDDDGDGMFSFDTSDIETTLLNGQTNVTVSYMDQNGNNLPSPLPNPFLTASQIITAKVTNVSSQDPDGSCYDETTIDFSVAAAAIAYPVPDFIECDDNNDGLFAFDTSNIEITLLNGQTGMNVLYYDIDGNTLPSPLSNPFTTTTQTIIAKVENQLSATCYAETSINFVVSEQPTANVIANNFVCDDITNDGEYTFELSNYNSQILGSQSPATFEVFYFANAIDAQNSLNPLPNLYVVNSTLQTVYARIQNIYNSNCYDITSFELGVHYMPLAYQPENLLTCDDESNDGIETFDLNIQNSIILNGQSLTDNSIKYYLTYENAENSSDEISTQFTNTENPQTIFARVENTNFTDCFSITSFQLIVSEQPILLMDSQWSICEGDTVEIIADAGYDSYLWSTGETTQSILVDQAGSYNVSVSNVYGNLICETTKTISVVESNIATITNIETVDWTQNNNSIAIYVEGNGDYEYSLDGINFQDDNQFNNLTIDDYTVYVRDKNGCGIVDKEIYLLYYPHFFTPNGDGHNETWQLINSVKEPNNKIYIFDRYGKLLKQLSPVDIGWDGTFNGNQMPTNDYWFLLERQNGKTYRGHFTLKR